jgi:hypothetical protein
MTASARSSRPASAHGGNAVDVGKSDSATGAGRRGRRGEHMRATQLETASFFPTANPSLLSASFRAKTSFPSEETIYSVLTLFSH